VHFPPFSPRIRICSFLFPYKIAFGDDPSAAPWFLPYLLFFRYFVNSWPFPSAHLAESTNSRRCATFYGPSTGLLLPPFSEGLSATFFCRRRHFLESFSLPPQRDASA